MTAEADRAPCRQILRAGGKGHAGAAADFQHAVMRLQREQVDGPAIARAIGIAPRENPAGDMAESAMRLLELRDDGRSQSHLSYPY
jgi:hypothetical protein